MIPTLFYVFLAALGLGFLIFIHELGHYFMAKWVGMKVETFSIGFGRAIVSWEHKGTVWKIGWLPFGGYVKITGMELDQDQDPYEIPGGYYSKTPFQRILVAVMGPLANFLFAILVFVVLWGAGGRIKNFSEYSPKVGWIDSESALYEGGIRPGDEVTAYDHHPYRGVKDHLYAPMTALGKVRIDGHKVDYQNGEKTSFHLDLSPYQHPNALEEGLMTVGVMAPASYLLFQPGKNIALDEALPKTSPMLSSGIEVGDRIVWADGEQVFSAQHLSHLLNDNRVLLTIKRGGQRLLRRVPRVAIAELRLPPAVREEFIDWQHESNLVGQKIDKLYAVPYNLTPDCEVEGRIRLIDSEEEEKVFPSNPFSMREKAIKPGDRILAVDGVRVKFAHELFSQLQKRKVHIIVERDSNLQEVIPWDQADRYFDHEVNWSDIEAIASTVGTENLRQKAGDFHLLSPIIPKKRQDFLLAEVGPLADELRIQQERINSIDDPEIRSQTEHRFQEYLEQKILGLPGLQDRHVSYNPNPAVQFEGVFTEVWRTLGALFTGALHPKWISGPIGIVQVVHQSWEKSILDVGFWLAVISLNLGILNLLPIPVLDGGYIALFLVEMATRRRIQPKTMERLIVPFVILVIGFILYVTYNDLSRILEPLLR